MADMVFVLDSSGSVGEENWQKVLSFVNKTVAEIQMGPYGTQVGVVTYGNRAKVNFHLNKYTEYNEDMAKAILDIPWRDQETNTSGGIKVMDEVMFTKKNGDRLQAPNIGIIITVSLMLQRPGKMALLS